MMSDCKGKRSAEPDFRAAPLPDDFFDVVPVGYLTLGGNGIIGSINLAGATLLGGERCELVGRSLVLLVAENDRPLFAGFLLGTETSRRKGSCEVTILTDEAVPLAVRIVATAASSGEGFHLALIDISGQKQAEGALLAGRNLLRTLAQGAPVGIFRADLQGECLYVNERWQQIAGFSYDEALFTGWERTIHPGDRGRFFAAWSHCLREQLPFNLEYRLLRPDGVITWVQGQALAEVDPVDGVTGYVGTITDITPQKEMEKRLRASESHLNNAQRLAQVGSWSRDYRKNTLSWSDGMFAISQISPRDFDNNFDNYLAILHPDDRESLLLAERSAHAAQSPYELEYRLLMPDGRRKWVHSHATATYDEEGRPLVMTGTIQDITVQREAREELYRTKELRNLIIDAMPAYVSYVDRECRYQLVNRRYEELTGITVQEIRGRHVWEVIGEVAWREAAPFVARVLGGEPVSYETEMTGVDGKLLTLQVFHVPDRDSRGGVQGYVSLIHDISEKKKTEQTLQRYSRRLIDLEEEVRKTLAAELHDELGPDLTALNFTLALIKTDAQPERRIRLVGLMADATELVDGLSGKLRNIIARLQPPVLSSYGLAAALRWYAGLMKRRTGMIVTVVTERGFPRLQADRELALFRVAKEAITNAAKYAGGKSVTVRLRWSECFVRLTVCDDGVGFTLPVTPRPGSGWGLSIMRMRAEMLGGSFRLKTKPDRGTIIYLVIPRESGDAD